jgi:catechol 2,3-dioxygenase
MTKTTIGTVHLKVASLERLLPFYQHIIGLQLHHQEDTTAYLGAGGDDLLALTETPGGKSVPGTTGLYHFAILVPSRVDLARSLQHLAETRTPLQGLSDHFVSEAIYLADPEGNGIEIYRDRPGETWYQNGQIHMGTVRMDVDGVIGELTDHNGEWTGLHPDTVMGHIHLHVSSVPETERFYRDLLGLDVIVNMGSATFMSYDGYHHHVGANIWAGRTPPPADALGLEKYVLRLPDEERLQSALGQLDDANIPIAPQNGHYLVSDPSQNRIVLAA